VALQPTTKPLIYRGAKEICGAVGLDYRQIAIYVTDHGLPAFKIKGQKSWIACPEDLEKWVRAQRDTYLGK
jgi:hypothetical protein